MRYLEEINEIHIEISSRCRLNCLHCSSKGIIADGMEHFKTADLKKFLSWFSHPRRHVYLTGGEPLLWEKLPETIALCRGLGFAVGLFTTFHAGKSCERIFPVLREAGLSDFYASLYDTEENLHDFITGVTGSYTVTMDAIKRAREYGISPKINFVLLKQNLPRLEEILKTLDGYGLDEIRILKLIRHGNAKENWERIGVSVENQVETVRKIAKRRGDYKTRITFAGFPRIVACRPFAEGYGCGAGKTLLYIDHYGNVYPCASLKNVPNGKIGTIFDSSTLSVYQNDGMYDCAADGGEIWN